MNVIRPTFIAVYLVDPHVTSEPQILLIKRAKQTYLAGIWQVVTGKMDHDHETVLETSKREVFEETGLIVHEMVHLDVSSFYNTQTDSVAFSANFLAFVTKETPVTLCEKEHDEYRWCNLEEAKQKLVFPDQKENLRKISQYFLQQKPAPETILKL